MVAVDGVVFFQVLDAAKAAYEVQRPLSGDHAALDHQPAHRDGLDGSGRDAHQSATRSTPRLLPVVDQATEAWGVKITRVEMKDIRPPADIVNAMSRQMKAEREKRATILESEGARHYEINCAPRA